MITPDSEYNAEGERLSFAAKWNRLVSSLIVESSVRLVARTVVDYGVKDGKGKNDKGIYPGNERLARETGLTARCVQEAWYFMRAIGMAVRVHRSESDGAQRDADAYHLAIPKDWETLPVLGPTHGRFACQYCGHKFNPRAANSWMTDKNKHPVIRDGERVVMWRMANLLFCAPPRKSSGEIGCVDLWGNDRKHDGLPSLSGLSNEEAWGMFYRARGENWD
jgi:hypothetical protein